MGDIVRNAADGAAMRCLYVIPELSIGGAERQLLLLARELQGRGHVVRILALHAARRPLPLDSGLDVVVLNVPPPHDPRCLPRYVREMRRFRPDVLHTFLFGFDLWANVAARLLSVPCVVSARRELATWQSRGQRWWQNAGNRFVDAVVANSLAAAEYACAHERRLDRGAVHVVHNACGLAATAHGAPSPLPPACGKTLVCIANFWPGKGHELLLRACAALSHRVAASLWLVGEGERQPDLQALAHALGIGARTHFLGRCHDIGAVLALADLYVHASLLESSPNAVLEAMAQGVPVVAFACGGVPELLDGGELGCLVPNGDGHALERAIEWALSHPDETAAMAERARGVASTRHAPPEVARRHERLYRSLSRRALPVVSEHGDGEAAESVALYTVGDLQHPSTRYRALQYVPALQEAGFRVVHYGLPQPGSRRVVSTVALLLHAWRRCRQLREARRFAHVFVQKALTPSRWRGLLPRLLAGASGYTFDLDDNVLDGGGCLPFRWPLDRLQNPGEAVTLVRHAGRVLAGNEALAAHCAAYNAAVATLPTVVDCRRYWVSAVPCVRADGAPLRLVWVGQRSTLPFLADILPWLQGAAANLAGRARLVLRVISDGGKTLQPARWLPLEVETVAWSLTGEVSDLVGAHVGLMPLRDDPWGRGKCGFKALQFMALGIPTLASPVGVNARIVEHGVNGYHVSGREEWVRGVETLARDEPLRLAMGRQARARVVDDYSLRRWERAWVGLVTGGAA